MEGFRDRDLKTMHNVLRYRSSPSPETVSTEITQDLDVHLTQIFVTFRQLNLEPTPQLVRSGIELSLHDLGNFVLDPKV